MQAQEARPPFIGLWSRLSGFGHDELRDALLRGELVRGPLCRATLHLTTAADFASLRGPCGPGLRRALAGLGARVAELDAGAVAATASTLLRERPRTAGELRELLAQAFPGHDPRVLGYAARTHVPFVLVPSADAFGFSRDPPWRLADVEHDDEDPAALVCRYLAAYGPASVADAQAWSGLAGLAATFETLRPQLACFADEHGRELFDLPGAPRPPASTPAPVRLLPEFDSVVLAHADRTRLLAAEHRRHLTTKNLRVNATVLHDGEICATWAVRRTARSVTLEVTPFAPLPPDAASEIEAEAFALLEANEAVADRRVALLDPPER